MVSEQEVRHVFVYGTLRRGERNDINRLRPAPAFVGMGSVPGRLYCLGWYPGLVLGGARAVAVQGEVYRIQPALEQMLDAIEEITPACDSEYMKRVVPVAVQGASIECLVYEVHSGRVVGKQELLHGDWLLFRSEQG